MAERILVVDDEQDMRFFLREALRKGGYEVAEAEDAAAALGILRTTPIDLVLLDVFLPGMSGLEAIPELHAVDPALTVIVITAHGGKDTALEAMQRGAYDYFTKPFKLDELHVVIRRALQKRALEREVKALREQLQLHHAFPNIIGRSDAMQQVLALVEKVSQSHVTVLITGESGTGKELIAEAIHHRSPRASKPFVKLNCVAIPEGLLESELFGHERGAFTGAVRQKLGKFELAHGGTIFLDEIGDMSPITQGKVLRVLQTQEFERVGGTKTIQVDVRVIAATNKDLLKLARENQFREDLYYRLNVVLIHLPPLRERQEEIPALVEHFIARFNTRFGKQVRGFSSEAMALLRTYAWPGNVRELEHCVERAVVLTEQEIIPATVLPPHMQQTPEADKIFWSADDSLSLDSVVEEFERRRIVEALRRTGGVQARAAQILHISERSLWHRIKKLRIRVEEIKQDKLS
jgi:DNA-binding NtrC family response regulator